MVYIQWRGSGHRQATRHPCLSDIDSPTAVSKRLDKLARRAALLWGGAKFAVFDSCIFWR